MFLLTAKEAKTSWRGPEDDFQAFPKESSNVGVAYRTTILLLEGMHQPTVRKNRLEPKSASTGKLQVCKFFCKL
jgi:hypothetical protein